MAALEATLGDSLWEDVNVKALLYDCFHRNLAKQLQIIAKMLVFFEIFAVYL